MEKIFWDSSYSVGVKQLDDQHYQIVNVINSMIDSSQVSVDSEQFSALLTQLTSYADGHFILEESILKEYQYPELAVQQREHMEYRKKIALFCVDTMHHNESVPKELLQYIRDWWNNHILELDMDFKAYLNERGIY